MYASPIIIIGLSAFAAQALADGIDTVVGTTTITVSTLLHSTTSEVCSSRRNLCHIMSELSGFTQEFHFLEFHSYETHCGLIILFH